MLHGTYFLKGYISWKYKIDVNVVDVVSIRDRNSCNVFTAYYYNAYDYVHSPHQQHS